MIKESKKVISYLLNPFELLRTKKVLQVNPTIEHSRVEPEVSKICVYDYNTQQLNVRELKK
ncbi:MAG: hypothetical protein IPP48_09625 [Chitinophagaceae bacterium]|nr:hypothetical protein [Chitinophagaceae bacterium]